MNRICIYPKDIQIITGKSDRQSRNIIAIIKKTLDKEKHQSVTIEEFCEYMGLKLVEVKHFIK
jgi:hypothetical protein